jgi:hypothetical protein
MSILDLEFRPQCSGVNADPFKHSDVAFIEGNRVMFKGKKRPSLYLSNNDYDVFLQDYQTFVGWLIDQQQEREKHKAAMKECFTELPNESNHKKLIPNYQQAPTFFAFSSNSRVDLRNINTVLPSQKNIIFENGSNFVSGGNDDEFEKFLVAYDKFKESERQRIEIETNCKIQNSFAYPKA